MSRLQGGSFRVLPPAPRPCASPKRAILATFSRARPKAGALYGFRRMGFDMRVSASGPISRVLSGTAIYLERESPRASSTQPERTAGHRVALLFALAPDGVYQAATLPPRWCALTAPFQLFSCVAHAACRCMFRAGEFSFLWHCPSGRPAQPLAGILPCGARTFLAPRRARGRLARSPVVL